MSSGSNSLTDARPSPRFLISLGAMTCMPLCWRAWPMDENSRMTLLKIPATIDLSKRFEQKGLKDSDSSIANLPPELQCTILSHLSGIDRICLALTCKSLAASAVASPHLQAKPWSPWLPTSDVALPSRDLLIQRLAHGWTDKSRLRYCQACKRILPRDPDFFQQQLQKNTKRKKKKSLPWNYKVCMEKDAWKKLSNKKRYLHIMKMWSESGREDSSVFSCNKCWTREFNVHSSTSSSSSSPSSTSQRQSPLPDRDLEKGSTSPTDTQSQTLPSQTVPVECPACVINSLLNTYKEPRKPKVRPFLWKWTKKTFSFLGNTILVFIYLLYLMFKSPFDLIRWLWRRYHGGRFRWRNLICMK